jgi:two-component system KDP operon response regulator KdpE
MFFRKNKVVAVEAPPVSAPTTKTESQDTGAPRKKILVVDDDPITVKTISMTLNARGYNVVSAADGPQAIQVMQDEAPDMMLVDVGLPTDVGVVPWNGFQVTQWLQRINTNKIPAIIISGSDKPEYKKQAEAIGAEAFMAKPLDNALLLGSIASALANPPAAPSGFVGLRMLK